MAHYALITRSDASNHPWRSCAILVAGGPSLAARQARALRMGGGLAFVPSPARFRIRRASRQEVMLLTAFFRGMGMPSEEMASQVDIDSGYARRERLLRTFFMALYLNPEGLRRKYAGFLQPTAPAGTGASGGVDMGDTSGVVVPALVHNDEDAQVSAAGLGLEPEVALDGDPQAMDGDESPLSGANQEDALQLILNSSEANDGGQGREQSFDLDLL